MGPRPSRCPICDREVEPGAESSPFCSARCQTVDLGAWLSGRYAIPGEPQRTPDDQWKK
jgi:endogenous inhibitor of DNA gyrase (YacG/DUF329 family)